MLAGISSCLPLRLINHGHAEISLRLVISAVGCGANICNFFCVMYIFECLKSPCLVVLLLQCILFFLSHSIPPSLQYRHPSPRLVCHLEMVQSLFHPSYVLVRLPAIPPSTSPYLPRRSVERSMLNFFVNRQGLGVISMQAALNMPEMLYTLSYINAGCFKHARNAIHSHHTP